jgi:hypothetical protein
MAPSAVVLLGLLGAVAAASAPAFNEGSDRGVFVYGTLVLDFRQRQEVMGRSHRLSNCSTETSYCADGELFNIVLPRFCADLRAEPGAVWRLGSLATTVIGRDQAEPAHAYPGTRYALYYLQTNVRPDVVYAYSPERGVIRIYYDTRSEHAPADAVDFAAMARDGRLAAFTREIAGDARREHLALHLLTLDQFAACLSEEFRHERVR